MKLKAYHTPKTLDETLALLDAETKEGRAPVILAGGTDVFVRAREGRMSPEVIVQIEALGELSQIEDTKSTLRLGARVSFAQLIKSPVIAEFAKVIALASREVGSPQIQSRGTVGGQLGTASPVGDLLPALSVLDADVICRSAAGERRIPITEWLRGVGVNDRKPNELIVGVEFAKLTERDHSLWFKLGPRRAQSISKVSLAGVVRLGEGNTIEQARLCYGAVAITSKRAVRTEALLTGKVLTPALIKEAVALVQTEFSPITDLRSTESYRRKMCGVLLRRGLSSLIEVD